MGYVNGLDVYQYECSAPASLLDPLGLDAGTQPGTSGISYGFINLPGNNTGINPTFYDWLLNNGWGRTSLDNPQWQQDGDILFLNGDVNTHVTLLRVPENLPACVNKGDLLKAISAFNTQVLNHEAEVREWYNEQMDRGWYGSDQQTVQQAYDRAYKEKFDKTESQWERDALHKAYQLFFDAYSSCKCKQPQTDPRMKRAAWQINKYYGAFPNLPSFR